MSDILTVEQRLQASIERLKNFQSLALLKPAEHYITVGLHECVEPSLADLQAIETSMERSVFGRAALASLAPGTNGGVR